MATFKKTCSDKGRVYLLANNGILFKLRLAKSQKIFQIGAGFGGNYPDLNHLWFWPKSGFYFKI